MECLKEDVDVGSSQPNHPACVHDEDLVDGVVDAAIDLEVVCGMVVVVIVILTISLQPNHPGVAQLVVVYVVVTIGVEVVCPVVVESSRQPHQPGVLHVVVLVLAVVVAVVVVDEVLSDPLLSKYFQLKQSTHSLSGMHSATLSYFLITLLMTS